VDGKVSSEILSVLWTLKKQGKRETTIRNVGKFLRVSENVDISDAENVEGFVANLSRSDGYKRNLVNSYEYYLKLKDLTWEEPVYRERPKRCYLQGNKRGLCRVFQSSKEQTGCEA
jgi:hypothetical protein